MSARSASQKEKPLFKWSTFHDSRMGAKVK